MSIQESRQADNYGSVEQPHFEQPSRKCCKFKYRVRYFYSKGAFLVLVWTVLISITLINESDFGFDREAFQKNEVSRYWYFLLVIAFACFPLAGWLADTKLGNYKVFKMGSVLSFLAAIVRSATQYAINSGEYSYSALIAVQTSSSFAGLLGIAACTVTALQLGLDQMPDASAENITSFIAWFTFSIWAGLLVSNALHTINDYLPNDVSVSVLYLMPSISMAIVCSSVFVLAPKYLVVEPKAPQSLKLIYQVLKFAAKHKAPLNRSAFTYWEDKIPSRLDLGKSRYGGPFTTEQVEDVKTFFKILIIFIPISIVFLASNLLMSTVDTTTLPFLKHKRLLLIFTTGLWLAFITVVYEFGVYPFIKNKLPSILRRIGIIAFMIFLTNGLTQINFVIYNQVSLLNDTHASPAYIYCNSWALINNLIGACATMLLINAILEFVCAQSPYNMRGLLAGYAAFFIYSSIALSNLVRSILFYNDNYNISIEAILTALSLIGLILYCVLAHWYKRRVRDEEYNAHRVVEEVYDRYLSHVH